MEYYESEAKVIKMVMMQQDIVNFTLLIPINMHHCSEHKQIKKEVAPDFFHQKNYLEWKNVSLVIKILFMLSLFVVTFIYLQQSQFQIFFPSTMQMCLYSV